MTLFDFQLMGKRNANALHSAVVLLHLRRVVGVRAEAVGDPRGASEL